MNIQSWRPMSPVARRDRLIGGRSLHNFIKTRAWHLTARHLWSALGEKAQPCVPFGGTRRGAMLRSPSALAQSVKACHEANTRRTGTSLERSARGAGRQSLTIGHAHGTIVSSPRLARIRECHRAGAATAENDVLVACVYQCLMTACASWRDLTVPLTLAEVCPMRWPAPKIDVPGRIRR